MVSYMVTLEVWPNINNKHMSKNICELIMVGIIRYSLNAFSMYTYCHALWCHDVSFVARCGIHMLS